MSKLKITYLQLAQDMSDHELARQLRKRGWKGRTVASPKLPIISFLDASGDVICKVLFDDSTSTKEIITLRAL
jgi:hypothetical protein